MAPDAEAALRRLVNLHTASRFSEALPAAQALVTELPDEAIGHYNLACVLARMRRHDQALDALAEAVRYGWRNATHARLDPDLAPLRSRPRFDALLVQMRAERGVDRRSTPEIVDAVTAQVPDLLERHRVPGATVALVRDGACVWVEEFGVTTGDRPGPVVPGTVFDSSAPSHLLVLMAAAHAEVRHGVDLPLHAHVGADDEQRGARMRPAVKTVADGRRPVGVDARRARAAAPHGVSRLQAGVEASSGRGFTAYCRDHVLRPIELDDLLRRRGARDGGRRAMFASRTMPATSDDLVRLLVAVVDRSAQPVPGVTPDAVVRLARGAGGWNDAGWSGAGAASIEVVETMRGVRVEVADTAGASGALLRWYPERGDGVVVLYNAASGRQAARRLAATALGDGER
jgi:CubicO group peptidase (beta-lactamase class C family)